MELCSLNSTNVAASSRIILVRGRGRGRPKSDNFEVLPSRSQRREIKPLKESFSSLQLAAATSSSLRAEHRTKPAVIIKSVVSASPGTVDTLHKVVKKKMPPVLTSYSPSEAFAMILDTKITVEAYKLLRSGAIQHHVNLYPNYHRVLEAKKQTYLSDIKISEIECSVNLQSLLNHTATRIVKCLDPSKLSDFKNFQLWVKYGMDGSSGQNIVKQPVEEANRSEYSHSQIFMVSLVPLKISADLKSSGQEAIGDVVKDFQK